jgi:hypothetical protein
MNSVQEMLSTAKALSIVFLKSVKPSVDFAIHEEMLKQFLEFKHVNQAFGIIHTFSPSTNQHATPAQLLAQLPKYNLYFPKSVSLQRKLLSNIILLLKR